MELDDVSKSLNAPPVTSPGATMTDPFSTFLTSQRDKPVSVGVALLALFAPSSLIVFLSRPELYDRLGVNGVLLISLSISLPILLLCYGLWWTPFTAVRNLQKLEREGEVNDFDLEKTITAADPLEWPCLLVGGWTANLVLFSIAAIGYYKPLRIGATFLLASGILLSAWLIVFVFTAWGESFLRKTINERRLQADCKPT